MKLTPLLLLVTAALVGCTKPASQTAAESPEASPPTPEPPSAVAVATPAPDPLAPEGVYFLVAPASVTTDDGIIGLKPGTRLESKAPGEYKDAAGHVLHLAPQQVTNNLRLAAVAAQADANAQAAVRQAIARASTPVHIQLAASTPAPGVRPAAATPAPNIVRAPAPTAVARSPLAPAVLGGTQVSDKRTLKVDAGGTYWMDDRGVHHYVK